MNKCSKLNGNIKMFWNVVYSRKAVLGVQGHNATAWLPPGHLNVWERHASAEHRDSRLVGRCGKDLLL